MLALVLVLTAVELGDAFRGDSRRRSAAHKASAGCRGTGEHDDPFVGPGTGLDDRVQPFTKRGQFRVRAVLSLPCPRAKTLQQIALMRAERGRYPADSREYLRLALAVRGVIFGGLLKPLDERFAGSGFRPRPTVRSRPARRAAVPGSAAARVCAVIVPRWVSTVSAKAFGEENSRFFSRVVTKSAAARPASPPAAFRRLAAYSASIRCVPLLG